MGKRLFFVILFIALLLMGAGLNQPAQAVELTLQDVPSGFEPFAEPRPVPKVSFQDGEGKTLSFSDFAGQVILVNYWATWCAPCVREMPSLGLLQKHFLGSDFKVVAISLNAKDPLATVRAFYEEHDISSLAIYNDPTFASFYALVDESVSLPYTLLIGRDGKALGELYGPATWHGDYVYDFINKVLSESQASRASPPRFLANQDEAQEEDAEYFPDDFHRGGCFGDGLFPIT